MPNLDQQTILLIILGVIATAILGQAILLFAIFLVVRKTARSLNEQLEEVRSAAMPIIYNTRELFKRVAPRLEDTAADLAAMAHGLRVQTADIQASAADVLDKMRQQSARLDQMVTTIFDAVDRATSFVTETISKPLRQLSGILATARSVIDSIRPHAAAPESAEPQRPPVAAYPPEPSEEPDYGAESYPSRYAPEEENRGYF